MSTPFDIFFEKILFFAPFCNMGIIVTRLLAFVKGNNGKARDGNVTIAILKTISFCVDFFLILNYNFHIPIIGGEAYDSCKSVLQWEVFYSA